MKIKAITKVGKKEVYDISVKDAEHYILENGVVTHNTGLLYSANAAFIIGRQQEKDGKDLMGYNFIINVEKSRYVKEKSKIPIEVLFEGGISKWSGLMEMALEGGFVVKPKQGWYSKVNQETGEIEDKSWRMKKTYTKDFWGDIITTEKFNNFIEEKYQIGTGDIMTADDIESIGKDETEEMED
jgi:hypothetical protein